MKTRSETAVATNGALVEVATIEVDGRAFSATGSIIDDAGGVLVGYVKCTTNAWLLTTWSGETICTLEKRGAWSSRGFYGARTHFVAWRATHNGRVYTGRNSGESRICRLTSKGA